MSEEEFFNRMINQISKVFDGRIATKMKNIYLKKDKQKKKKKEILDKIKEIIKKVKDDEFYINLTNKEKALYEIERLLEEKN